MEGEREHVCIFDGSEAAQRWASSGGGGAERPRKSVHGDGRERRAMAGRRSEAAARRERGRGGATEMAATASVPERQVRGEAGGECAGDKRRGASITTTFGETLRKQWQEIKYIFVHVYKIYLIA